MRQPNETPSPIPVLIALGAIYLAIILGLIIAFAVVTPR